MTEPGGTAVDVVRGEMQPWTDYAGAVRPPGGVVLRRLLADVLPDGVARALIVGPHDDDVVEHVAARAARLTVLLRSVTDAAALRERLAAALPERDAAGQVAVVAGALDGLADRADGPYDLIVAADGLDRVLGPDSRDLDWPARLAALAGLAGAGAVVVVGCANEFALTEVLDRRPAHERHGDEEWRPIHDDP
ncbi:MAG TPA: hypothetical protein VES42_02095, partial [Pilimelia sp.]|nr:hypothetical protein [Pilimelia sp.]